MSAEYISGLYWNTDLTDHVLAIHAAEQRETGVADTYLSILQSLANTNTHAVDAIADDVLIEKTLVTTMSDAVDEQGNSCLKLNLLQVDPTTGEVVPNSRVYVGSVEWDEASMVGVELVEGFRDLDKIDTIIDEAQQLIALGILPRFQG